MLTELFEGGNKKKRRWSLALEAVWSVRLVRSEHAVYCLLVFM